MAFLRNTIILTAFCFTIHSKVACQLNNSNHKPTNTAQSFSKRLLDTLPGSRGFVSDFENLFTDREELFLDSIIRDFEKRTTIQIAIITIDTTMTTSDNFDAYTLAIANYWGIGQKDKNNGIAIGISAGHKRIRIQNGYGIEKILTDAETKKIIDTTFLPYFREAKYFEGTVKGVLTFVKKLEALYQ